MPETKKKALARAKKKGFPKSSVTKSGKGYFIAPKGVTSAKGKRAYAKCRAAGGSKSTCAAVSHNVNKKAKKKK